MLPVIASRIVRYVRVTATNAGVIPDGLPGAGNKAWLFVEEIVVE
jgi:hexosaminidase